MHIIDTKDRRRLFESCYLSESIDREARIRPNKVIIFPYRTKTSGLRGVSLLIIYPANANLAAKACPPSANTITLERGAIEPPGPQRVGQLTFFEHGVTETSNTINPK